MFMNEVVLAAGLKSSGVSSVCTMITRISDAKIGSFKHHWATRLSYRLRIRTTEGYVDLVSSKDRSKRHQDKQRYSGWAVLSVTPPEAVEVVVLVRVSNIIDTDGSKCFRRIASTLASTV